MSAVLFQTDRSNLSVFSQFYRLKKEKAPHVALKVVLKNNPRPRMVDPTPADPLKHTPVQK